MTKKISLYCVVCNKEITRDTSCNFHYECLSIKDKKRIKPYKIQEPNKKPKINNIIEKPEIVRFSYNKEDTTIYF